MKEKRKKTYDLSTNEIHVGDEVEIEIYWIKWTVIWISKHHDYKDINVYSIQPKVMVFLAPNIIKK
mgnify:CR=1 FL=1